MCIRDRAQEALCFARRLPRLAVRQGGLRLSPIRSRAQGHVARRARWDRCPLGLDFGPRARFDQLPK
eukprot:6826212-Alexandrium_andersonii.AAC.1